jgi:hypothetical protein
LDGFNTLRQGKISVVRYEVVIGTARSVGVKTNLEIARPRVKGFDQIGKELVL